jgi:CRP-like cAMP-binding protein
MESLSGRGVYFSPLRLDRVSRPHPHLFIVPSIRSQIMRLVVPAKRLRKFDPNTFLSTIDGARKIADFAKKQTIFAQGDSSDAVFYIQEGKVQLTVVSAIGKEATIGILKEGEFSEKLALQGGSTFACARLRH